MQPQDNRQLPPIDVPLESVELGEIPDDNSTEHRQVNTSAPDRVPGGVLAMPRTKIVIKIAVVTIILIVFMAALFSSTTHRSSSSASESSSSGSSSGSSASTGGSAGGNPSHARAVASEWRKKFVSDISSDSYQSSGQRIREWLKELSRRPHIAGTPRDRETADFVKDKLSSFEIPRVEMKEYKVLLNYPARGSVEIISPEESKFVADLTEPVRKEDPISEDETVTRAFHGYSASGNATGTVVYANYGTVEDFEKIESLGISVKGRNVIMRYGKIFRGNKVENAEERGAIGALIYSDPADDGAAKGGTYPDGPYRSLGSVQRGSVFYGEGDPLTPGFPAIDGLGRISMEESRDPTFEPNMGFHLPSIPSIPLSARDAAPIMMALRGKRAPTGFAGALADPSDSTGETKIDYFLGVEASDSEESNAESNSESEESRRQRREGGGGGGKRDAQPQANDVVIHLENEMTFAKMTPIWQVLGIIPGAIEPDRVVILGNHRDAWVGGAVDPSSGTAALLEIAHQLGAMFKGGWRPRRTIVLASHDAEEYGLVGSIEWGEELAASLGARAVAYLNCDEAVTGPGPIQVRASPSLIEAAFSVAKEVPQPPWEVVRRERSANDVGGIEDEDEDEDQGPKGVVAAKEMSGDGQNMYEVWLQHYRKSVDQDATEPGVSGLGAGSDFVVFLQHLGIASADITIQGVPPIYGQYHSVFDDFEWMGKFGDPKWNMHPAVSAYWGAFALQIADDDILPLDYVRVSMVISSFVRNAKKAALKASIALDFATLESAVDDFGTAARAIHAERDALSASDETTDLQARMISDRMMLAERAFLNREGIPGRPWFKHVIYSPSKHDQYASESFPGLSDAIFEKDASLARRQLDVITRVVLAATQFLKNPSI